MHKVETLGRHILVEYYNCDPEVLKDPELIEQSMNQAALEAKATIVDSMDLHLLISSHVVRLIHGRVLNI